MLKTQSLSYKELDFANPLLVDYYDKQDKLSDFYQFPPSVEGLLEAAQNRSFPQENRQILHRALTKQLQSLDMHPAQKSNLDRLKDSNTRTITTGHQLVLFTGPLYTIYKIATTIKLARELNSQNEKFQYVPIYWMATEDHDFEEVNHAHIFGKTIQWNHLAGDAVGRIPLDDIQPVLDVLYDILGDTTNAEKIKEWVRMAYQSSRNLTQATRLLIHELFKEHGLLIIDGDDAALKKLFIPVLEKELADPTYSHIVNTTSDQLKKMGYKKQVNPREINIFYLHDGERHRIIKTDNGFQLDATDHRYSLAQVTALLYEFPERFSPNVIMRPLYQETVLPNIAYIGGAGELTYWFQLKKGFDHFNLPFPVLVLRNSATIIDASSQKKINKLQLHIADLFGDLELLLKKIVSENTHGDLHLTEEKNQVQQLFEKIIEKSGAIDQSVQQFVRGEQKRVQKSIETIEKKMMQAEKKRHETSLNQIRGLKSKLFPNKGLQERYNNFFPYYLSEGDAFINDIIDTFDPLNTDHIVYSL